MTKETFLHIIYIPFVGVGLGSAQRRNPNWLADRIQIFKDYTLKSLLNQEERNFILWASFTQSEKYDKKVGELANYLKANKVAYIFTFDGLMYWDDKFNTDPISRLKNFARIVRDCWRNGNMRDFWPSLREVFNNRNKTLVERLGNSLRPFKDNFATGVNWFYVTRIDSDDMFHKSVVKEIQKLPAFEGAYVMKKGYIHNRHSGLIAEYLPKTNPPFHTIIFRAETFLNPAEHFAYFKDFRSHEDITRVFRSYLLPDFRYCVLTHNPLNHISTGWNHPFRGELVDKEVLKDFGL